MAGLGSVKPKLRPAAVSRLSGMSAKRADSWRGNKSSAERGYGHRWRVARAEFLKEHPLCVFCEKKGLVTLADVVDHIKPHRGVMDLFWDRDNWQSLCKSCHNGEKQKLENG